MIIQAAVVYDGRRPFELQNVELDVPRPDEVLVRIVASGICHTDLVTSERASPDLPMVLGHEGAGVVARTGSAVTKVQAGDHVVLTILSCGCCEPCQHDQPAYCRSKAALNFSGTRKDGTRTLKSGDKPIAGSFFGQSSFATYALAYERNLVKIPKTFPLVLAAPLGCGIQTGAGAVLRSLDCRPGTSIMVAGAGTVGLAAVLAARYRGCLPIVVVEPHANRRALALKLGATHAIDPSGPQPLAAAISNALPGGADYVIDTSGLPDVIHGLVDALAPLGKLGVIGLPPNQSDKIGIGIMTLLSNGLTVRGIVEGDTDPDEFIPELITLFEAGHLPYDTLIQRYPFADINRAIADQNDGRCVKAVLLMNDGATDGE